MHPIMKCTIETCCKRCPMVTPSCFELVNCHIGDLNSHKKRKAFLTVRKQIMGPRDWIDVSKYTPTLRPCYQEGRGASGLRVCGQGAGGSQTPPCGSSRCPESITCSLSSKSAIEQPHNQSKQAPNFKFILNSFRFF